MKGCTAGLILLVSYFSQSLIATPAAVAQSASFAQRLYGTWYTYPLGNPATDSIRHEFRNNAETGKDEMIVTHICGSEYVAVIARVTSPIEVSENGIKILQSASRLEKQADGSPCQVSIDAGAWNYVLSSNGDRISITNPGGSPNSFQLARQDVGGQEIQLQSIFGTWLMPAHQERGATVQIKLIFYESADQNRGKIRQIATCSKVNDSLVSQADSAFKMTKDQITIVEADSHYQSDGPISCLATISPGALHYVVSPDGGTMVLSKPGAPPIILTRER